MKNTILLFMLFAASPLVFGQAVSSLDAAIEQQVQQQTGTPADATRVAQPRIAENTADPRIMYVGGKPYQLRKKNQSNGNGEFNTHEYVNSNDTMTVNISRANYGLKRAEKTPAGFTVTSNETLSTDPDHRVTMMACEKRNADGSCEYIVKKTERDVKFVSSGKSAAASGEITKSSVTIKQTFPAGSNVDSLKANTYQAVRNTNINRTFSPNINRGGPNDLYGPESYPSR